MFALPLADNITGSAFGIVFGISLHVVTGSPVATLVTYTFPPASSS